jgi:hypothetical protein
MKLAIAAALAVLLLSSSPPPAGAQQAHAFVYCVNGRIEVDSRNPDQMRIARGSGICLLGQFGFMSDAQSFAQRNFGGAGRPCSCR